MGALRAAAIAIQFGAIVGGAVVVGLFGGRWLDSALGTAPAFLLSGLLLGLAVGPYLIWIMVRVQRRRGK